MSSLLCRLGHRKGDRVMKVKDLPWAPRRESGGREWSAALSPVPQRPHPLFSRQPTWHFSDLA